MNNANVDGRRDSLDDPHDDSGEYDDEDHTARFGAGKRKSTVSTASASSNDTVSALDRVKSLAKRNQEVSHRGDMGLSWLTYGCLAHNYHRHSKSSVGCD